MSGTTTATKFQVQVVQVEVLLEENFISFIFLSFLENRPYRKKKCKGGLHSEDRERLRERLPGNSAIRAAKQQAGASPVTAARQ